jgi:hypothetical protein
VRAEEARTAGHDRSSHLAPLSLIADTMVARTTGQGS